MFKWLPIDLTQLLSALIEVGENLLSSLKLRDILGLPDRIKPPTWWRWPRAIPTLSGPDAPRPDGPTPGGRPDLREAEHVQAAPARIETVEAAGHVELLPEPEAFLFRLDGIKAQGALVESNSDFELLFEYRSPRSGDLLAVRGQHLPDPASSADVEIAIVPGRLTCVDGVYLKVAHFRNGALSERVAFTLRAEAACDNAGLHVFLSVNGCAMYDFPVAIQVVESLAAAVKIERRDGVRVLNLDELAKAQARRTQRDVQIIFSKVGGQIYAQLHEPGKPQLRIPLERFDAAAWSNLLKSVAGAVKDVSAKAFWNTFETPLQGATDPELRQLVKETCHQLITVGSSLYRQLGDDENLLYLLDQIEQLPVNSRISVRSNCGFLPLEILYRDDYHYSRSTEPTASLLWGYRFRIEHLIWEEGAGQGYPVAAEQDGPPFVSLNLDTAIDVQLSADRAHQPPFLPVGAHDGILAGQASQGWQTEFNRQFPQIQSTWDTPHAATLLYYYCHGKSDTPFSGDPVSKLAFGTKLVDPDWIHVNNRFLHAPLIVLNSCASGEAGPLSFLTFLDRFRHKGAAGLVSTWFAVPMLFASAFGRELIMRYARHEAIGDILFDLRRMLLDQDNPLGLFYALQCPMDLRAPTPAARKAA